MVTSTHTNAHTTATEPQTFICKSYKPDLIAELSAPVTFPLRETMRSLRGELTRSPYLCFRLANIIVKRPITINWNDKFVIRS